MSALHGELPILRTSLAIFQRFVERRVQVFGWFSAGSRPGPGRWRNEMQFNTMFKSSNSPFGVAVRRHRIPRRSQIAKKHLVGLRGLVFESRLGDVGGFL
jgi:hypothetical protein